MNLEHYKNGLEQAGVLFAAGLSESEIDRIQRQDCFFFPPDMKSFLMFALPVSHRFINWLDASEESISESLSWPYEGMCFDIEHNSLKTSLAITLDEAGPA